VKVPEGWARATTSNSVSFTDKLNTVQVTWFPSASQPTVPGTRSSRVPALRRSARAFTLGRVLQCAPSCSIPYSTAPFQVKLAAGAVVLTYQVNSAPNAVTGKQYRLEVIRFEFYRAGTEVDLILSGPVGSDNVDPWRLVAQSFRWI
jgi:hypothetical protein